MKYIHNLIIGLTAAIAAGGCATRTVQYDPHLVGDERYCSIEETLGNIADPTSPYHGMTVEAPGLIGPVCRGFGNVPNAKERIAHVSTMDANALAAEVQRVIPEYRRLVKEVRTVAHREQYDPWVSRSWHRDPAEYFAALDAFTCGNAEGRVGIVADPAGELGGPGHLRLLFDRATELGEEALASRIEWEAFGALGSQIPQPRRESPVPYVVLTPLCVTAIHESLAAHFRPEKDMRHAVGLFQTYRPIYPGLAYPYAYFMDALLVRALERLLDSVEQLSPGEAGDAGKAVVAYRDALAHANRIARTLYYFHEVADAKLAAAILHRIERIHHAYADGVNEDAINGETTALLTAFQQYEDTPENIVMLNPQAV
ncbi:MAG: hypothetical protein Q7T01_02315, partial [bacterium]|nr:hypothetical protein [bacterium]